MWLKNAILHKKGYTDPLKFDLKQKILKEASFWEIQVRCNFDVIGYRAPVKTFPIVRS